MRSNQERAPRFPNRKNENTSRDHHLRQRTHLEKTWRADASLLEGVENGRPRRTDLEQALPPANARQQTEFHGLPRFLRQAVGRVGMSQDRLSLRST